MSGRKLHLPCVPLGGAASSLPKQGGRKQVDNAEKPATKCTKATANISSSNEDDEGSRETDPQPVKGKTKAKGTSKAKKGKKTRCVASFYVHCCKVRAEVPWEQVLKRRKVGQRVPRSVLRSWVCAGQRAWLQPGGCALIGCRCPISDRQGWDA